MSSVNLNPEQKRVVDTGIDASTCVMAGAGTGKTRVLVERYLNFLDRDGCRPGEILALTFTLKAAGEMRARIHDEVRARFPHLVNEMYDAWIMNFHQFGLRLMRENAPGFGVDPGAGVVTDTDARAIETAIEQRFLAGEIDGIAPDFAGEVPTPARMSTRFELIYKVMMKCRDEMRDPATLMERVRDDDAAAYRELVGSVGVMAREYDRELLRRNLVDFNDMIARPAQALAASGALRKRLSSRFRHILVDEYQDTSVAQDRMLRMLAGEDPGGGDVRHSVTIVGDVKQAIYRFRNAKVENIQQFPGEALPLADNYRSTQPVLDLAHAFVKRQERLDPAALRANRMGDPAPVVLFHPEGEERDRESEAAALAGWVRHLTTGEAVEGMPDVLGGARPIGAGEVTVLLRGLTSGYGLATIEKAFLDARISYAIVGGASGPEAHALETLHALLSLLVPGDHGQALLMVLEREPFTLRDESLMQLFQGRRDASSVDAILADGRVDGITDADAAGRARELAALIADMRGRMESMDALSFLQWAIESSPFALHVFEGGLAERAVTDLSEELLRLAHDLERRDGLDLRAYLEFVRTVVDARKFGEESELRLPPDRVRIMTIHQAKGLEFKAVALAGIKPPRSSSAGYHISPEHGLLLSSSTAEYKPWNRSYADDAHRKEERAMLEAEESCLIYVGITRAEDYLFVSSPDPDGMEKRKTKRTPWRFADLIAAAAEVEGVVECRRVGPVSMDTAAAGAGQAAVEAAAPGLRTEARERIARWRESDAGAARELVAATWAELELLAGEAGAVPETAPAVDIPGGLEPAEYGTFVHEVMRGMLSVADAGVEEVVGHEADRFGYTAGRRSAVVKAAQALVTAAAAKGALDRGEELRLEEPFQVRAGRALFGGVFDRIERTPSGWRVIDYKVGTPEPSHRSQVAYYMWALGEITGTPASGEIWYLRGDGAHVVDVPADPGVGEIAGAVERLVSGL